MKRMVIYVSVSKEVDAQGSLISKAWFSNIALGIANLWQESNPGTCGYLRGEPSDGSLCLHTSNKMKTN